MWVGPDKPTYRCRYHCRYHWNGEWALIFLPISVDLIDLSIWIFGIAGTAQGMRRTVAGVAAIIGPLWAGALLDMPYILNGVMLALMLLTLVRIRLYEFFLWSHALPAINRPPCYPGFHLRWWRLSHFLWECDQPGKNSGIEPMPWGTDIEIHSFSPCFHDWHKTYLPEWDSPVDQKLGLQRMNLGR